MTRYIYNNSEERHLRSPPHSLFYKERVCEYGAIIRIPAVKELVEAE